MQKYKIQEYAFVHIPTSRLAFAITATTAGRLPVWQAGDMLAMHCLVQDRPPDQYCIYAVTTSEELKRIAKRLSIEERSIQFHAGRLLKTFKTTDRRSLRQAAAAISARII